MVYPQSGCIVVSWDRNQGQYQKKCNFCGYIETYSRLGFSLTGIGTISLGVFSCPKCKKSSEIKIGKFS